MSRRTRSRSLRSPLQPLETCNNDEMSQHKKPVRKTSHGKQHQPKDGDVREKEEVEKKHTSLKSNSRTATGTGEDVQKGAVAGVDGPTSRKRPQPASSSSTGVEEKVKVLKREPENAAETSESEEEEQDYETMRKNNIRDNEAFFSSLGIDKAKERLQSGTKPNYPRASQFSKKRERKPVEKLPKRKSLRIQRIDPTGAALPPEPEPEPFVDEHPRVAAGPVDMLQAVESEAQDNSQFRQSMAAIQSDSCDWKPLSSDLDSFVGGLKKMRTSTKAKVCKDRLFSVALHPTTDKVLAMAGDKWGRLGVWDLGKSDQSNSVVTYRPHSRPVGHIAVHPSNPLKIFTSSYDATLRCADIEKGLFQEVYSVPEEEDDLFRSFDFLSPTSMLLAQFRGDIALLDTRTHGQKAQKLFKVCDKYLRTVSVHPTNANLFCTAGTDRRVCVWDMRKLHSKGKMNTPLHAMMHGKSVSSAYFSPVSGSHILSCSADDTLNVFSFSSSCAEVLGTKVIRHDNRTGRWLTPFRSVWHPAREDVFFVGSMKRPRKVEAFGVDGCLLHEFDGETLSSICSVVQFHPSQNVMVGGNSSGYIFPFM